MENLNEETQSIGRLGKLPARSSTKSLLMNNFLSVKEIVLPKQTTFWKKRSKFPLYTFGNDQYGDCTRAKQAIGMQRMERIENNRTPIISSNEVVRVYFDMTKRLYGGGDTGAYEEDALSEWRKPDLTFKDTKGHPLTIDAFLKINHTDINEIKKSIYTAGAHGIAVCFNLPLVFSNISTGGKWEIPKGQSLIGNWMAGSWGGHSMWVDEYSEFGIKHVTTWGLPDIWISWDAAMAYCDEAHLVIDSLDVWKKTNKISTKVADNIKDAVNQVSSFKIK